MQYQSFLQNIKIRVSAALVAGIFFKFISDVIFGLLYKNYSIFQPFFGYFQSVGLAFLVIYIYYLLEKRLNNALPWNQSLIKRFLVQLALEILIIFSLFVVFRWLILWLFYQNVLVVITDELILIFTVILVAFLYNLLNLWIFLLFQWRHSLAEMERFKKESAESKFEALQNQITPHFLFNSLNTLSSLMYENVDTAASYIRQLSSVYRYVLENSQTDLVPLKQELTFIDAYEYLLGLRFSDRLLFKRNIDNRLLDSMIAPMTLQLLIENAVKHNVISAKKPLTIEIVAQNGYVEIRNNVQIKTAEGYSSGQGLKNIQSRYQFLSPNPVVIENSESQFVVQIPLIESTYKK
ncbi:MAG: hypothetical protein A2437_04220 [Bacteroidetes bacterium RIFOXYC2_FULL_40_12]|nr:MAG: hypothetical protein A2437_04220 [Bacteroidetes bacterium RIFOXYC2_FULL_40_12]